MTADAEDTVRALPARHGRTYAVEAAALVRTTLDKHAAEEVTATVG